MALQKILHKKTFFILFFVFLIIFLTSSFAAAISKGHVSNDDGLKPGMIVKLSDNSTAEVPLVERATNDQLDKIIGVATTVSDSAVTIASADQSVYVETAGKVKAYVSDINGKVKNGDSLTISPLNGILAKSDDRSAIVLGIALEDFSESSSEKYEISGNSGMVTTNIARIQVNFDQSGKLGGPKSDSALAKLGESIVGKDVSEVRVLVALVIFVLVLVAEGAILYGSISSAISSLGRNPLAKNIIKKELFQVVGIALAVLMLGLAAVYAVLWF